MCTVLPLCLYDLSLIVIHRFLCLVALEEDLTKILQMVLFSHELLIGIVGQSIITLQYLWISPIEDIKDSAVFEDEVLIVVSGLLANYFEDIQCVEKYLVLLEL